MKESCGEGIATHTPHLAEKLVAFDTLTIPVYARCDEVDVESHRHLPRTIP